MIYKSYKIRLEPNNKQLTSFRGHAGVSRHAYNQGVNYCKERFEAKEKIPGAIDLHKWLVATVKKDSPWYYEYSKCSPQQALRDLESAYKEFHRIQKPSGYKLLDKKGRLKGTPNFKRKGVHDSFYLEGSVQFNGNKIKLPKIGWVRLSEVPTAFSAKNCTISRTANEWFVAFKQEYTPVRLEKDGVVGVDIGIKTLATLSNGESFVNPKPYKAAKNKLRRQQQRVSARFVKGAKNQSSNYSKAVTLLAKTHQRVANVRKDTLHKLTTGIATRFETVVIEDLKPSNMVKNHKLASAIIDGGFSEFKRQLTYKMERHGGTLILANTFYPSSKKCSDCGNKKDVLKLSERVYECHSCGTVKDRDLNAAINLRNLAGSSSVTAFGENNSMEKSIQVLDELGMKHQMFTFV
jgi:putative transposase